MEWMREVLSYAERPVAGNPLWAWAAALAVMAAAFLALLLLRRLIGRRLAAQAERTGGAATKLFAQLIQRTWWVLLGFGGVYAGTLFLGLPPRAVLTLRSSLVVLALVQAGIWANTLIWHWLQHRLAKQPDTSRTTAVVMLSFGGKLAVWTLVLLLSLENVGVNVTALIAGLGVGGIAVALAVQNVLGDLLGSVAIALDKPFEVGDFIIVGDLMGTVEYIGLKTTRVRSLFGEQIVFSNADLLGSRIRNFKRMKERRVVFSVGVVYSTPPEKVEAIPSILRQIVEAQPAVRFDRAHFQKYGDFALVFEVVYHVMSPDYNLYMDRQQAINLDIYRRFAKDDIRFAYPTQTLYVHGAAGGGGGGPGDRG
jgi:small-conductance mechanosensitive channel